MAGNDGMKMPWQGGKEGERKVLEKFKEAVNPTIKGGAQSMFQFGDEWRGYDLKQPNGQMPRKMEANVVMNNIKNVFQPPQGKVTDYIKKFDPQNTAGAIKHHLDTLDKLLKKGDQAMASMTGMLGGKGVAAIQQSNNQMKPQCPERYRYDEKQQKCVLDCPPGQIWDENSQRCIIDEGEFTGPPADLL